MKIKLSTFHLFGNVISIAASELLTSPQCGDLYRGLVIIEFFDTYLNLDTWKHGSVNMIIIGIINNLLYRYTK